MSLRAAKFGDHWRSTIARKYALRYVSLDYSNLRGLQDGQISFSPGITAIVGGNGVGKSTLAHAIADVLSGPQGIPALRDSELRLNGSTLRAELEDTSGVKQLTLAPSAAGRQTTGEIGDHEFAWLDPSTAAMLCQRVVLGDRSFHELLEGFGQRTLTPVELASASYVVGKDYAECRVWEVRDYGPLEVWPYFRVTCNGIEYGSEDMGRGELAVLVALWAIDGSSKNSILVLEEPETHVSARSQSALMDMVAWSCATKGLYVVVTTHSPVILQKLPKDHLRLLVSEGAQSRLVPTPNLHEIASIVGGGVAYKSLVMVEDQCARQFLQTLLEQLEPWSCPRIPGHGLFAM